MDYFSRHGCSRFAISFSRILYPILMHDSYCFAIQHSVAGQLGVHSMHFYDVSFVMSEVYFLFD